MIPPAKCFFHPQTTSPVDVPGVNHTYSMMAMSKHHDIRVFDDPVCHRLRTCFRDFNHAEHENRTRRARRIEGQRPILDSLRLSIGRDPIASRLRSSSKPFNIQVVSQNLLNVKEAALSAQASSLLVWGTRSVQAENVAIQLL
ncbi:MAG: hypothetical protein Q9228_003533 [Teloschistes exilis]